jgi:FkbM family methyltransferase
MDYSNPWLVRLRSIGQRLGILRPVLGLFRRLTRHDYEDAFRSALLTGIQPGQVVWDVGANVGLYSELFAQLAGPAGRVVAFEPSPRSYKILCDKFFGNPNVTVENVALTDWEGVAPFYQSDYSPTDGLSNRAGDAAIRTDVQVRRGDAYIDRFSPEVIKMDIEGYEVEALQGMPRILSSPRLKYIFLEVHFLLMKQRGLHDASTRIVGMLKEAGFAVRWTDPSHLVASRAA